MKILFVRLSAFGDIIHALPALCATRRWYPEASIHWLVSRKCADLLKDHPAIDRLHVLDSNVRGFLAMRSALRRERFDVSVDLQGLMKSGLLSWLSGAPRRIGRAISRCRERAAALFYTEWVRPVEKHIIKQNLELIRPLGVSDSSLEYRIALPSMEIPPVFRNRPVAVNVGAGWPTKRWAPQKWGELSKRIMEELHLPVVIFWGPGEEEDAQMVHRIAPGSELAPRTTYREMGALLQHCSAMVSGESGGMHMAVAVGTPAVCLIGVTDPERNGPLSPKSLVVLPPLPHRWTYRRKGKSPTDLIQVENVLSAVRRVLHGNDEISLSVKC